MYKKIIVLFLLSTLPTLASAQLHWQYTGDLSEPKFVCTINALSDGTALLTGGLDRAEIPSSACELYDPATESWSKVASMQFTRERHTANLLENGSLVVIGGAGAGYPLPIEIYNPATKSWDASGSLIVGRQNHTSTLMADGRILIAGGFNGEFLNECEVYDPATQITTRVASMNQVRHDHEATLLADGRVLVEGGRVGGAGGVYLNQAEIYDPVQNTWTVTSDMNQAHMTGSLTTFSDGSVLAAGGRNSPTSSMSGSEMYDFSTQSWAPTSPMLEPVHWQGNARLPEDRFLVVGGFFKANWESSTNATPTPKCEWYDKGLAHWYFAPTLNLARCKTEAIYLHQLRNSELPEDLALVAGGLTGNGSFTQTTEILDVTPVSLNYYIAHQPLSGVANADNAPALELKGMGKNIFVRANLGGESDLLFNVYTLNGADVRTGLVHYRGDGIQDFNLGLTNLPAGFYVLRVTYGNNAETFKIALQ